MISKAVVRSFVAGLLRWTGLRFAQRWLKARRAVTIVAYHDPSPAALEAHLAWYSQRYNFTTLDVVASALETGCWDAVPSYPLVLTFDDGHRGNAELAPLFRKYGLNPTLYLCSRIVGTARPYWWKTAAARRLGIEALKRLPDEHRRRLLVNAGDDPVVDGEVAQALSWNELENLREIANFGGHTRTHPILPRCDDASCAEEIAGCKQELQEALGGVCDHFAFPNGDFSERELREIRNAGYRTARTIEPGWNDRKADPLQLKAFSVSDDATAGWLAVQLTGLPALARRVRAWGLRCKPPASGGGITVGLDLATQ